MTTTPRTVRELLRSLGLEHHADAFEAEHVSVADLAELDHADLKNHFGIQGFVERKRILQAVGSAPSGAANSQPTPPGGSQGVSLNPTPPLGGASVLGSPVASQPGLQPGPYGASVVWGGVPSPVARPGAPTSPANQSPVWATHAHAQLPPLLAPGQGVGDFVVDAFLGRGGFGEVYRVRDPLGALCAVKVVQLLAGVEELVPRLWEEWALVRKLDHIHLLVSERPQTLHISGLDVLVFPMDLADGGSLRAWLQRISGERAEAARLLEVQAAGAEVVRQVALGLASLHGGGKVHLDVKPENILRQGDLWKLADFGLSRDVERARLTGPGGLPFSVGTGPYMSPEQVLAARPQDVGPEADVWGLGVVLFEVLDGHPPYAGDPARIRELIRDRTVRPSMRGVPQPFRGLVERCLSHAEGDRPRAEDVAAQLGALLLGKVPTGSVGSVSATPVPPAASPSAADSPPAKKNNIVVDPLGAGDARTIADALKLAVPGTVIQLKPGIYWERIELSSDVVLEGSDREEESVIEHNKGPVVLLSGGKPVLRNLAIRNLAVKDAPTENEIQENGEEDLLSTREVTLDALSITGGHPLLEGVDVTASGGVGIVIRGNHTKALIRLTRAHHCGEAGFSVLGGGSQFIEVASFENSSTGIEVKGEANPTVKGGKFYKNQSVGILIREKATGTFENCESFLNKGSCISVWDEANPVVKRGKFHESMEGGGIFILEKAKGTFENCESFLNKGSGLEMKNEANPTVKGCKFHGSMEGGGILIREKAKGMFENCESFMNKLAGLRIDGESNPIMKGCKFHGSVEGGGIFILEKAKGTFENCESSMNKLAGIEVSGEASPMVKGGKFYKNQSAGILIHKKATGTFENCESLLNKFLGIRVSGEANPMVKGCKFHGSVEGGGIVIREKATGTFENCESFQNEESGIQVGDEANPTVKGCKFHGGAALLPPEGHAAVLAA
jgi:serine/threonine protein kinase